jgi:hypothetical protein
MAKFPRIALSQPKGSAGQTAGMAEEDLAPAQPSVPGPAGIRAAGSGAAGAPRTWPWDPDQTVAARLAIASLQKFFIRSLSRNGRLQLETVFCTVGALTGFAAQNALRQASLVAGRAETDGLLALESTTGERFYFGDRLNEILVPHRREDLTVWSVVAGEAMRLGASGLSDCVEIFERVTKSIGTPAFGVPTLPQGNRPWLMPRRAVEIFWPSVRTAFTREPVVPVPGFKLVEPRHWPLALAVIGAGYLSLGKESFPPARAVALFMEAAVAMSKLDSAAVIFVGTPTH